MNLPRPTPDYNRRVEDERNRAIEQADSLNRKRTEDLRVVTPYRFILVSPDGTEWSIGIDNAGALTTTSL
jgi:hypothetical protein